MIDNDDCGAVAGMQIGRGNQSTRRKPAPLPLYPQQQGQCYCFFIIILVLQVSDVKQCCDNLRDVVKLES
jgi:hypothetical protein